MRWRSGLVLVLVQLGIACGGAPSLESDAPGAGGSGVDHGAGDLAEPASPAEDAQSSVDRDSGSDAGDADADLGPGPADFRVDSSQDGHVGDSPGVCVGHCRNGSRDCGELAVDCGGDCVSCADSAADVYVDPLLGDDDNTGARGDPVASVSRARDLVRVLRGAQPKRESPVVVLLRGGTYRPKSTIVLAPQDSGTVGSSTVYRAYPAEVPTVSGGRPISGWNVTSGRWTTTLPEVPQTEGAFTQLWVDGKRRYRPRLPKDGHYFIYRRLTPAAGEGQPDDRFGFRGELRADWHNLSDVEVLAWHKWNISRLRIATVDTADGVVSFTGPTRCTTSQCHLAESGHYLVENVREALRNPGEWYLDTKTDTLTYLPVAGEDPALTSVVVPRLETLLALRGAAERRVEHVSFEGIRFAHTHWATPVEGYSSRQAEGLLTSAAIVLEGTQNVALRACTVEHTGAHGLIIGANSHETTVERSTLTDLGAGGIWVGPPSAVADELVPRGTAIRDNLITSGGRMHPAGVGVLITNAAHTTVEHNDVFDFYYTGISVGWVWNYVPSNSHHNIIRYNRAHLLGQRVLSDLAGIYTLGISPGTHLHHNLVYDVTRHSYGAFGIYFDQASSFILAEHNVVHSTQDAPFMIHYGEQNTLRNNIFVARESALMRRSKVQQRHAVTAQYNVFATNDAMVQRGYFDDGRYTFDHNLYWTSGASALDFGGRTFAEWQQTGQDQQSAVADPRFVGAANHDYRFGPGSPATKIGIEAVDLSTVGRRSRPRSIDLVAAPRAFPPATSVAPIVVDFEGMPTGTPPTKGESKPGESGAGSLVVTTTTAAAGAASLRFVDAADIPKTYKPYYYLRTQQAEGRYRLTFYLRRGARAAPMIELRDWRRTPYTTGPELRVKADGALVVAGKTLTRIPADRWVKFELTVGLGSKADGSFSLTVQPDGGAPQVFEQLACRSADFAYLSWVGFISPEATAATYYLDEIRDAVLP